ncbi:hypothetical protein [Hymenobacter nivis]|uniref:hypothetical protein n=1 Tax=Hymenobacter nivis TaxID=1850093 RepID=UPI00112A5DA2|nr:hypothetical protein [Hymenobacter nivis]
MIKPIPPFRWETPEAREWVAHQLGLPYHDGMQDWPWEVATPEGLNSYFHLYHRAASAERIVLMEMLLQAASEQSTPENLDSAWLKIEELLDQNTDLHASTAEYWCMWSCNEQYVQEYGFSITPFVRKWWIANYPMPMDLNPPLTPP